MNQYKSLIKNSLLFAIGNIGSKTISFFMLPLYTRMLTTSDYGQLDVLQTTISLLIPLITFQAIEAVFRYSVDMRENESASSVLMNGILLCLIGMLIGLLLFPIFRRIEPFSSYTLFFYLILFFSMLNGVLKQFVRGLGKIKTFVASDLAYTASFVTFNIIFLVYLKMGLEGYFLSMVLAHAINIFILLVFGNVFKYLNIKSFDKSFMKTMLIYSVPLIPNGLMLWVMSVSDRYILTYYLGFDATGIYSVSYKFPSLITLVNSIFFMAWQLSAIQEYGKEGYENFYKNIFGVLSSLLFLVTSLILLILKPLMSVFVADAFYESWKYVPMLLVGTVFQAFSSFFGTNYTASKKTKGAFTTSVVGAVVNIVVNFILIPFWGIQAAAFSTLLGYLAMWLMRVFDTKKYVDMKIDRKSMSISLLIIGLQIVGLYFIEENALLFFAVETLLIVLLLVTQRKYI
ncbi:lipopolysaccharide biosynthesis protein, partial [Petrotoga sp. 9PWA.NaAc.5.4]|uniref:lipopolysaccharide biosynthesis protein n=1 Tax=Petrotoga sp. 9PWA.NaAc.5.4 TaxID=1434328 RepID=UPI000CB8897C